MTRCHLKPFAPWKIKVCFSFQHLLSCFPVLAITFSTYLKMQHLWDAAFFLAYEQMYYIHIYFIMIHSTVHFTLVNIYIGEVQTSDNFVQGLVKSRHTRFFPVVQGYVISFHLMLPLVLAGSCLQKNVPYVYRLS